jgi:DMSO reductase anchor subunit
MALIAGLALAGLDAERWLFFSEARHVANLYHGSQRC